MVFCVNLGMVGLFCDLIAENELFEGGKNSRRSERMCFWANFWNVLLMMSHLL